MQQIVNLKEHTGNSSQYRGLISTQCLFLMLIKLSKTMKVTEGILATTQVYHNADKLADLLKRLINSTDAPPADQTKRHESLHTLHLRVY